MRKFDISCLVPKKTGQVVSGRVIDTYTLMGPGEEEIILLLWFAEVLMQEEQI